MLIVLDNAESVLDPQGGEGREIYGIVKELSEFTNICLIVTSRITTIPPDCKRLDIPTLSIDAARSTFHRIHDNNERSDLIDKILEQLDFHPLSVTLLATVAYQNNWKDDRLTREWDQRRTGALQTEHNESLAATIELSLTSPMFKNLGSDARELLGVVAFFPQGINEGNIGWLFPTISDPAAILDKFCILSLTHRSSGFITMLVPLREYLRPRDPLSSPLLCVTRDSYFTRLSVRLDPDAPGFGESRWITQEDANVEYLLCALMPICTGSVSDCVFDACSSFMQHLYWHKPRRTVLGSKIEGLPDDHHSKHDCLYPLAQLLSSVGDFAEQKRLLHHTLKLERERGSDCGIAAVLRALSDANRHLGLCKEGIDHAREALETYERIGDTAGQGSSLTYLAISLRRDNQLDAAEEAASRAINLLPKKGEEYLSCQSHRILADIYRDKGERENAIRHLEIALGIASQFQWNHQLTWIHQCLAMLFRAEGEFDNAYAHIEKALLHAVHDAYLLGYTTLMRAWTYYQQGRLEEATSEAWHALETQKFGEIGLLESCEELLQCIERDRSKSDSSGELLEMKLSPAIVNHFLSTRHRHLAKHWLKHCLPI